MLSEEGIKYLDRQMFTMEIQGHPPIYIPSTEQRVLSVDEDGDIIKLMLFGNPLDWFHKYQLKVQAIKGMPHHIRKDDETLIIAADDNQDDPEGSDTNDDPNMLWPSDMDN